MARSKLVTGLNATVEQIAEATARTVANIKKLTAPKGAICPSSWLVEWGQAEIMEKLGIFRLDRENPSHVEIPALFTWGNGKDKQEYAATNNATNRALSVENFKHLLKLALANRYTITGEPLIFDSDNMAASAQHRLAACFVATIVNPDLRFLFIVQDGIDPLLVDYIDTGKGRSNKDIGGRHKENVFPVDVLRTSAGLMFGKTVEDARKAMIADATSACSRLWHRANGKDVNSSTTEYSKAKHLYPEMLERFEIFEWENPANGGEVLELSTLERCVNIVYNWDREQGGAISKYFGRGNLISALVMASNIDNPTEITVETITSSTGRETQKVTAKLPETLAVDLDLVSQFCRVASDKTGPFAPLYSYLETRKGKNALDNQYKFGAMVNCIKYFQEHRSLTEIGATFNEAGEQVTPPQTIVSCPPLPGNMVPNAPRARMQGGKSVVPALDYPHFGGFDVGLQDTKSLKDQAALEKAVDEANEELQPE